MSGFKSPKTFYSIKPISLGFICYKLDEDFEEQAHYHLTPDGKGFVCDCPAHVAYCRHIRMYYEYKKADKLASGELYDFEGKQFIQRPSVEI